MSSQRVNDDQIDAVRHYLEREFPGCVTPPQSEPHADGPVIEIVHDAARHQVEVASAFLAGCPGRDSLRHSELADYIREARTQNGRFLVQWQEGEMRIRFKPR